MGEREWRSENNVDRGRRWERVFGVGKIGNRVRGEWKRRKRV